MLVGFCILNNDRNFDQEQFFPIDVNVITKRMGGSILYLYGYGSEYEASVEEKTYSLYQDGLDCRNIHVRIGSDYVEFKSDWLGSFPCYYDEVSGEVASHWGMLDLRTRDIDCIGSYTLKKYSYIPTSRTLKLGVKRMLSNQTLIWRLHKLESRESKSTIVCEGSTKTADVINRIVERFRKDGLCDSEVSIPLSGGYDSRFLASIVKEDCGHRFRSFTYSLLGSRGDCFEAKVSKVVAQKLASPWASFDLTGYARYEQTIIDWTGGFTHVNGDYYEMFAEKAIQRLGFSRCHNALVVSGIVGDLWCGKVSPKYGLHLQAGNVLYSHGISTYGWMIDSNEKKLAKIAEDELNNFFNERIHSNDSFLVELVRAKVALLSFLCYSFERRGVRCSAPFLDKAVVQAVLCLDPIDRLKRKWQGDYFTKLGLSDKHLPSVMLKINRLAIDEGAKKKFNAYGSLIVSAPKIFFLKLLLSKHFRMGERLFTRHKVTEYLLRKVGYKRSEVLISILNVVTK